MIYYSLCQYENVWTLTKGNYTKYFSGYKNGSRTEMISNFRTLEQKHHQKTYQFLQYFTEEEIPSHILNEHYNAA